MTEIRLPKYDADKDSATLVAWEAADGAKVSRGDVLCTIETNKATVEIEANTSGYLRQRALPGREYAVKEILGLITDTPDEAVQFPPDFLPLPGNNINNKVGEPASAPGKLPAGEKPDKKYSASILGTGSYVPEKVMTNLDVINIGKINTTDEWIRTKIGVTERRFAAPGEATSDLSAKAAERALKSAGISPNQIGLIVLATSVPDRIFPSTACIVQKMLGASNAAAFDINVMCTGTVFALDIARRYIEDGSVKYALVIGAEVYSKVLDFTDRESCIYFGDGAGAMVLARSEEPGILASYVQTDGTGFETITALAGGTRLPATHETVDKLQHSLRMNPKGVWNFATEAFPRAVKNVLERTGITASQLDLVIPHQANINIIRHGMAALGLSEEKAHMTISKYGNTSAASIAITLDDAFRRGRLKQGNIVALVGFGGGLAWGAALVRWTAPPAL